MENKQSTETLTKEKQRQVKMNQLKRWVVLVSFILSVVIFYITYRGSYLETLEMGEQYLSIFWQNLSYQLFAFFINFFILFVLIYLPIEE